MRFRWVPVVCLLSTGLAGCETTQTNVVVSDLGAPAQPASAALSPDIRKILSAGGLDVGGAGANGAVPGKMALAALPAATPPSPAVLAAAANPNQVAAVEPGQAQVAPPAQADASRGRKGRRGKALPTQVAAAPAPSLVAMAPVTVPETLAAPASAALTAPRPAMSDAARIADSGGVPTLPEGPLPRISPLSPPAVSVRLPGASMAGVAPPPGPSAPQVTIAREDSMDFVNRPSMYAPVRQPQVQAQYPAQPGLLGGAVSGPMPTAQQYLQPVLDPNNLVSQPRFTSRAHAQIAPHVRVPLRRMAEQPRPVNQSAAYEAPAAPVARAVAPAPVDNTPTVRRF